MQRSHILTLAIVSVALFMVTLDNLVVTNALVSIREDLGASLEELEWTVNAYTLSFAVFLLTAAALGDRLGRRAVFAAGIVIFTVSSAAAALAPSTDALIAARALQGLGGAVIAPVSLTLLSEAFSADRRGLALGIVRAQALGWTSTTVVVSIAAGVVLLAAFVAWERRAPAPMLPMRFFRNRAFAATNGVSLAMFFGAFGSIFLLAQFFQVAQGYSPLEAGIRTLPWTAMPIFVAPIAGILSDRIGSRPLMAAGLALQAVALAWLAIVTEPDVAYGAIVPAFVMAGTGMALVFAPAANAVLSSVRPDEAGPAAGATNTIPEVGGGRGGGGRGAG